VPTTGEAGLPEMKVAVFNGIFAPAATAAVVIDTLYQATRRAMQEGGLARELEAAGAQALADAGPERSRRFVEDEVRKWTPVVRASGIRLE
jgi:tripartite-type tricarboxylate transporter receptor subunit TctC